ncbi:MAG: ATP synthase subunit I [Deltaproteobacteria bacterium]|nr:ATP synthase subunit I [Deltaproteobacteria bacterium]MBW1942153.1 ATP synthase subunit I [Deltaproteobacteria bacterium]MBW2205849.1 ATP synthase subunit I [Deltaproteobacteria bacterium]
MDDPHTELSQIQRKISLWAFSSALILALVFMLLQEKAIAKGLLLGTCFSIINFILLGKSLPMTLLRSRPGASLVGLASIFLRYAILAIPLIIGVKSPSFNLIAVIIGVFAIQIVTLFDYILIKPLLDRK